LGFAVLRLSYAQVVHDWGSVEDAVERLVDRGEHLARDRFLRTNERDASGLAAIRPARRPSS
jgi:hypothetical protein